MKYILIDFENTRKAGLEGLYKVGRYDEVCLLYSEKADSVPIDMLPLLSERSVRFWKVKHLGPNALDLMLCWKIGERAARYSGHQLEICVISKDKQYDTIANQIKNIKTKNARKTVISYIRCSSIGALYHQQEN